jgi:hypothetical protein
MRCRYCGKELALFKRLTKGGEFCSEAHKQSYQDEYNRLALTRLLQAQKKGQTEASGPPVGPPPAAPVAVEEPAAAEPVLEQAAASVPVMKSAPLEISNLDASVAEEEAARDAPAEPEAEPEPEPDAEPLEIADFLADSPAIPAWPDETPPHLEPWLEFSSGPAVANWHFQDEASTLSTAALVSLDLPPNARPAEHPVASANLTSANLTPREFTNGHGGQSTLPWKVTTMHQLPSAGPVSIEFTAKAIDFAADPDTARELDFETAVLVEDSQLLELPSTGIEFPNEDSDVVVGQNNKAALDSAPAEADPTEAAAEDDSPRASLEALSKLHQDLVQDDLVQQEEPAPEESPAMVAEPVPVAEAEPLSGEPTPGRATELLDVAIRMFPPPKPVPIEGAGLASQSEALLPHLKSLPLRPKVAVASGYAPPPTAPAQPRATASAAQSPPRPSAPSKPAPAARPAARITQPTQQPTQQPKQPPAPVKASEPSKPAAKFQPPSQAAASKSSPPAPARPEIRSAKTNAGEPAGKPTAGKEPAAVGASVKAAGQPAKPVAEETAKEVAKPAAKQPPIQPVKQPPGESAPETVPNFGAVQLANSSLAGSLKVKLGIAIALLVVACSTWLGWGGKSRKPASNSAISADGSGPSIIMGEGGWVEGWGGDPSGLQSGRQITMYRPSLKLSDYRIEFQGSIETKSIGWVFRAADPDNYYALKLMAVSSGLTPKVALFKYLVINGRQTQVGRVPIDLTVQADTVFSIRTDVRGPQFSTYVQGRQVDVWTDDQLKAGGVGFLNEREERGKVKSVSIRYLNGAAK